MKNIIAPKNAAWFVRKIIDSNKTLVQMHSIKGSLQQKMNVMVQVSTFGRERCTGLDNTELLLPGDRSLTGYAQQQRGKMDWLLSLAKFVS
ncbi:hypothetical protein HAX54_011013 [Datura stramonium]|uniref:Uncharacterized protein n=1 Tax=Datura stramonium TaxID=4076 RepID=A0ABS8TJ24_DATST|nr:hypothetical protein [Datura stramonium]